MKRKLALILAFVMIVSLLSGCGKESSPAQSVTAAQPDSAAEVPSATVDAAAAQAPVASVLPSPASEGKEDSPKASQAPETAETAQPTETFPPEHIERGKWSDYSFTNNCSGISFSCPSDWLISSDEELALLIDDSAEALQSPSGLSSLVMVPDFMVTSPDEETSIMLVYENLAMQDALDTTPEMCVDSLIQETDGFEDEDGFVYSVLDACTVPMGGNDYSYLCININDSLNQHYFFRRVGNYMACVIISDASGSDVSWFEEYFK